VVRGDGVSPNNTVEATIREVAAVGALIDAALAAGATSLTAGARLADPTEALAEARRRAGLTLGRGRRCWQARPA
jgi:uncharacterized protein YggE